MGDIVAPLGSRRLRHAPRLSARERESLAAVEQWTEQHPQSYVAVSGGKDSLVCLDLARRVNPAVEACFLNSGLEFPQTLAFLDRLRHEWGVTIHEFHAEPSALEVMAANGSWEHGVPKGTKDRLHQVCVTEPLARARAVLGPHSIYGLRADESAARLMVLSKTNGHVTVTDRKGNVSLEHLAPIWRWSFEEVHAYLGQRDVPLNPIYAQLFALGVPPKRARVGLLVDGWALDQGRWVLTRIIAPELCRQVETRLPILAEWR